MKTKTRAILIAVPLAVVILAGGAFLGYRAWNASRAAGATDVATMEERWGIRVTLIGVTADGGLIDFRYQVIDPDKAIEMDIDPNNVPTFVIEGTGVSFTPISTMAHRHDLRVGRIYSTLYVNQGGVLRPGDLVTVIIGDAKLEHFAAQ